METFEFNINKCIESKKILNSKTITREIYRKNCSWSKYIGNCTDLYAKLKPVTYEDFYERELKYAEDNHDLPIEERGLTYEEFYLLAVKYKTLVENASRLKYDISVYFYGLICHAIVETFVGQKKEELIMEYIARKGFTPQKVSGRKDAKYGVDIEVNGNGQHFYIQVKPISFFLSNYSDTHKDRIDCCRKREEILALENAETYYIIYELDWETSKLKWLVNKKGRILFKISDLFQYEKDDIKNTIVRFDLPTEYIKTLN